MFRISLRTFLIATVTLGVAVGLFLQSRWQSHRHSYNGVNHSTNNGVLYNSWVMTESEAFRPDRLLSVVIVPKWIQAPGVLHSGMPQTPQHDDDLEAFPNGVYFRGELIAGYKTRRVVVSLSPHDAQVIALSQQDLDALARFRGKALIESETWKQKVEPEIDRLVTPYTKGVTHYRNWRIARGLPPD